MYTLAIKLIIKIFYDFNDMPPVDLKMYNARNYNPWTVAAPCAYKYDPWADLSSALHI